MVVAWWSSYLLSRHSSPWPGSNHRSQPFNFLGPDPSLSRKLYVVARRLPRVGSPLFWPSGTGTVGVAGPWWWHVRGTEKPQGLGESREEVGGEDRGDRGCHLSPASNGSKRGLPLEGSV